jgi:hypothetical protein
MSSFSELQCARVVETIARLERRMTERFPGSGLSRVCAELREVAERTGAEVERLRRPIWPLRVGAAIGVLATATLGLGVAVVTWRGLRDSQSLVDLLQGSESAVNEIILLAMAVFFVVSIETRVKRRTALRALHRLRSIVHIADMHQLTKDPEYLRLPATPTASSPPRGLTRVELGRYLDYCSELFSLTSKVAALYVQHVNDPVVLDAVNDIETLAASLSNKVWQKIVVLNEAPRSQS